MATDAGGGPMTAAQLRIFAEKLDAWGRGLDPAEQALLLALIGRAAGEDTRGHGRSTFPMVRRPPPWPGVAGLLPPLQAVAAEVD